MRSRIVGLALVAALLLCATAQAAPSRVRVGDPHQARDGAVLGGPAAARTPVDLRVALLPRDPAALAAFVADPQHELLARGAFRARFGPTARTLAQVRRGLRALGLRPGAVTPNGLVIRVRTTAAIAERAFRVRLREARLADGRTALVNVTAPSLPRALGRHVEAVAGFDTQPRVMRHRRAHAAAAAATPDLGAQPCSAATSQRESQSAYTFDEIARAYGFESVYAGGGFGQGTSVAVMEWEPYAANDVAIFQSCYGTSVPVTAVNVDGGPGDNANDVEATMDIQTVIALAPQAQVLVYQGSEANTDAAWIDVFDQIATDNRADVISTSWGSCEAQTDSFTVKHEATVLAQMAAQGQSFLASSGDQGSEDCQNGNGSGSNALAVDDPGTQPLATSVGGTSMTALGPPPVEQTWNDGISGGAGGGGISANAPMPSWQTGPGVVSPQSSGAPCSAPSGTLCRQVPDVSALAGGNTDYLYYWQGQWTNEGGTSASTPLWAAMMATLMSHPACGGQRFGLLNPKLYAVASTFGTSAFNDITIGTNDAGNQHGGLYPATPGYDMATGLGTPIGGGLLTGLCG